MGTAIDAHKANILLLASTRVYVKSLEAEAPPRVVVAIALLYTLNPAFQEIVEPTFRV